MTDLICVHRWSQQIEPVESIPIRVCGRCDGIWYEGDNEPRVIIGRLSDVG